jgi:hypothetical protein
MFLPRIMEMNTRRIIITPGTVGPVFYDVKIERYPDNLVIYHNPGQTGVILKVKKESLTIQAYNSGGEMMDELVL